MRISASSLLALAVALGVPLWILASAGAPSPALPPRSTLALAAPAPPVGQPHLRLTIAADRSSYLSGEPILIDWALFNPEPFPIRITMPDSWYFSFEGVDGDGKPFVLYRPFVIDTFGGPRFVPLGPRQAYRGWLNLRVDRKGLQDTGSFRLRALYKVAFVHRLGEKPSELRVQSNDLRFEVRPPKGAEAAALEQILKARIEDLASADQEDRESAYGRWSIDVPLCERILTQAKAPRYAAASALYAGLFEGSHNADPLGPTEREYLPMALRFLRACVESPASSPYAKGLSRLHLAICLPGEQTEASRAEARKLARGLLKDYPGTAIADQAEQLLQRLDARPRK